MLSVGFSGSLLLVAGSSGCGSQRYETESEEEVLAMGRAETDLETEVSAFGGAETDSENEV